MKLVYICAPYHADTAEGMECNKEATLAACQHAHGIGGLAGETVVPITPIVNFPYLNENDPTERAKCLNLGLALLSKCDELWVAGDRISEGMRGEIRAAVRMGKPVLSLGLEQAKIQEAVGELPPMLGEKECLKNSADRDYTGKLLILKPSSLAPWAREPENQIWQAENGFGCNPNARGRAVFATCLNDGEKARFDRDNFCGIADPSKLPSWAQERLSQNIEEDQEELAQ